LIQTGQGPDRRVPSHLLGHDALGTKPASVLEDGRAVASDVFVEQDARLGIAQQQRQRGLAVEKRPLAKILTIVLDQVKGLQDRSTRSPRRRSSLESGQAVRPQHDGLAVDREALGLDPPGSSCDRRQPRGPIKVVAGVRQDCRPVRRTISR
jgi:hypothetical protein